MNATMDPAIIPEKPADIELIEEDRLEFPLVTAHFKGEGVQTTADEDRLRFQYDRIFALMHDRKWRTLGAIEAATGYPQASISAQLRFMTRQEFGSHVKNKERRGNIYFYQIVCNRKTCPLSGHPDPFAMWLREEERIHGR